MQFLPLFHTTSFKSSKLLEMFYIKAFCTVAGPKLSVV